jgi:hypothetical protein
VNHDALLDFHRVLIHYSADVLKADGIIPQDNPMPVKRQADPEDIIDLTVEDDFQCGTKGRKKAKVTKNVVNTEVKKESFSRFG